MEWNAREIKLNLRCRTEERKLGFGSPDHLRPSFPFIGLRLWVEEASSVLLFRLCFFDRVRLMSINYPLVALILSFGSQAVREEELGSMALEEISG
ncbi:hypothetical protein YC2023_080418 [Brassica napus]